MYYIFYYFLERLNAKFIMGTDNVTVKDTMIYHKNNIFITCDTLRYDQQ